MVDFLCGPVRFQCTFMHTFMSMANENIARSRIHNANTANMFCYCYCCHSVSLHHFHCAHHPLLFRLLHFLRIFLFVYKSKNISIQISVSLIAFYLHALSVRLIALTGIMCEEKHIDILSACSLSAPVSDCVCVCAWERKKDGTHDVYQTDAELFHRFCLTGAFVFYDIWMMNENKHVYWCTEAFSLVVHILQLSKFDTNFCGLFLVAEQFVFYLLPFSTILDKNATSAPNFQRKRTKQTI